MCGHADSDKTGISYGDAFQKKKNLKKTVGANAATKSVANGKQLQHFGTSKPKRSQASLKC